MATFCRVRGSGYNACTGNNVAIRQEAQKIKIKNKKTFRYSYNSLYLQVTIRLSNISPPLQFAMLQFTILQLATLQFANLLLANL